ncbi:MAG: biotin-dependent carboxyltransferase [Bacteroidales bacterium]|nr:biotin-dependent carboxyltransferase [Bacteroidales bacterium]
MDGIKFIKEGFLTTIQDLGRYGFQKFGMPVSGAMDSYSLKTANWLVGNPRESACFEITFQGPEIEFHCETVIGLSGAPMQASLNGNTLQSDTSYRVFRGDILRTGIVQQGVRSYLAIAGEIEIPEVMGSKSTYLRGRLGGFHGRKIEAGDEIAIKPSGFSDVRQLPYEFRQFFSTSQTLRIIPGTEVSYFELSGITSFLTSEYTVSPQNDRMGYRLSGQAITHKSGADIISSGITNGSIQVPGHGQPIIMLADHQTVGGYTQIANIVSVDIPLVGQLKTGDKIHFRETSLQEAHDLIEKQEQLFKNLYLL